MLIYVATYPRCGNGVLHWLILLNFGYATDSSWIDSLADRAALAADPRLHFVKTHSLPHDSYLPGERAVQLVRHPAAAIASHYNLNRARRPDSERPLARFIAGQRKTGDWTGFHRAWAAAPLPFLRLRYEDAVADPEAAVRALSQFLSLPMPAVVRSETAEEAHRRAPGRNPNAGPEAWRRLFDADDLQRLVEAHGELAAELGYVIA